MTVPSDAMIEHGFMSPASEGEPGLSEKRNPDTIARLLAAAGFAEPEIEEMPVGYRFANAEELWFFVSELRGSVARTLAALNEADRAVARAALEERVGRNAEGGFQLAGISLNVVTS